LAFPLAVRKWPGTIVPAQWLAHRTLPLYVLHFPVVAALSLSARNAASPWLTQSAVVAALYPLLMTAAVTLLCLLLHRLLLAGGLGWLFEPPMKSWRRSPSLPARADEAPAAPAACR
jgi:peptidoglycan/LPS O-acetylase OafA/YrhL